MSNGTGQRRSIFGGVLLILIGALFLAHQFVPALGIGHLLRLYWPVLLIIWGLTKLWDNFAAQRTGEKRPPFLTGGEVALLFFLGIIVAGMVGLDWLHQRNPDIHIPTDLFDHSYVSSEVLPAHPVKPGAPVMISLERGDITVHTGTSPEIQVTVHKTAEASNDREAAEQAKEVAIAIAPASGGVSVQSQNRSDAGSGVRVDLEILLPPQCSVTARTNHGNILISGVAGKISATSQNGDLEIHDAGADVAADLHGGDARINGVHGNLRLTGNGKEIELSDVTGDATLEGDFYGPIRVRNVTKTTHLTSSKTDLTVVQLSGRMETDSGRLEISDVPGSVSVITKDKDVALDNIGGRIHIENQNGDIDVRFEQPPREEINIANNSGGVDLSLPEKASFEITAASKSGEIESDFDDSALKVVAGDDNSRLDGKLGTHGPQIRISTSYGTIHLRKT
jgi:hypothetical protein